MYLRWSWNSGFFFANYKSFSTLFPKIFTVQNEEIEEGTEQTEQPKQVDSWGFLPLLLSVCKETNETLTTIYDFPISLTLYLGTYIIEQNEKQAKELEQQRLKYKR